jgi:hypothetical protein
MGDILQDLRDILTNTRAGTADSDVNALTIPYPVLRIDIERAIAEIERLRSLVGAVSAGPSFAEMTKDTPRRSTEDTTRDVRWRKTEDDSR